MTERFHIHNGKPGCEKFNFCANLSKWRSSQGRCQEVCFEQGSLDFRLVERGCNPPGAGRAGCVEVTMISYRTDASNQAIHLEHPVEFITIGNATKTIIRNDATRIIPMAVQSMFQREWSFLSSRSVQP